MGKAGWEYYISNLYSLSDMKSLTSSANLLFDNSGLYWSPDEQALAIVSYISMIGGEGREGLFVSNLGSLSTFKPLVEFTAQQTLAGAKVTNVVMHPDHTLSFTVTPTNCPSPTQDCTRSPSTSHTYNFASNKVTPPLVSK